MTRIAIIGAGYMATEHARAFAAQPGARIVGVVGRSRERAQALATMYDVPVFGDVESLWREAAADVVVVAVSELSMASVCEQVFSRPWTVLLEKPVGVDLDDARRILDCARIHGAHERTWVGLNRRSYGATRTALDQISDEGPRLVSVLDQQDMSVIRQLGAPEEVVRNYMYSGSIHMIDYFSVFCRGELESMTVAAPWTLEAPGYVVATLLWSSGDRGVYQAQWDGPGPWAVSVSTRAARFEMRPLESLTVQSRGERRATPVDPDPADSEFKAGLFVQSAEVLKAASGGQATLATLEDALRSMQLCADIYGVA
jgi:predicted dehydrogenase